MFLQGLRGVVLDRRKKGSRVLGTCLWKLSASPNHILLFRAEVVLGTV